MKPMHPIRAIRLRPRWQRVLLIPWIVTLYRRWGNTWRDTAVLTWRAVLR